MNWTKKPTTSEGFASRLGRRFIRLSVLTILLSGLWNTALFADSKVELNPNPEWCKPGYRCLTVQAYTDLTLADLETVNQLRMLKLKTSRFGWTLGVGLGVGGVVDTDFHVQTVPTSGIYVVYGIRF